MNSLNLEYEYKNGDTFPAEDWNRVIRSIISSCNQIITQINTISYTASVDTSKINEIKEDLDKTIKNLEDSTKNAKNDNEQLSNSLKEFKETVANDIQTAIQNALDEYDGSDNVWSSINNLNNQVTTLVNKINNVLDNNNNIKYSKSLQSVIDTGIANNSSFNDIASRYAVLNENQEVIEWLSSGFKSNTKDTDSFASMYTSSKNEINSAISNLKTEITQESDGKYVSKNTLASEVTGIIEEGIHSSLSSVVLKSDLNEATSTINTKLDGAETSLTSLKQQSDVNKSKIDAITAVKSNGTVILSQSTLEDAMVQLLANKDSETVTKLELLSNEQIAKADINASINNAISSLNLATESYADNAASQVSNTLSGYIKDSNGNYINSAELKQTINENSSSISNLASHQNSLEESLAGYVATSELDSAVATVLAKSGSSSASQVVALSQASASEIDITSAVNTSVNTIISTMNLATESYVDNEVGEVNTSVNTLAGYIKDSNGNYISSATLQQSVNTNSSSISALASRQTTTENSLSGFVASANLDQAVANVLAQSGSASAAQVVALSTVDESGVDITSAVNNAISSMNLATKSYVDDENDTQDTAISEIGSYLKDSNGNYISSSSLKASVDADHSTLSALTTWKNNEGYKSGLVAESSLDGSVATLLASGTSSTGQAIDSKISTSIQNGVSNITLDADNITVGGSSSNVTIGDALKISNDGKKVTLAGFVVDNAQLMSNTSNNNDSYYGYFGNDPTEGPILSMQNYTSTNDAIVNISSKDGIDVYTSDGSTNKTTIFKALMDGSGAIAHDNLSWANDTITVNLPNVRYTDETSTVSGYTGIVNVSGTNFKVVNGIITGINSVPQISFSKGTYTTYVGEPITITTYITPDTLSISSYTTNDSSALTVTNSGEVTPKKEGTYYVTANFSGSIDYEPTSKNVTVYIGAEREEVSLSIGTEWGNWELSNTNANSSNVWKLETTLSEAVSGASYTWSTYPEGILTFTPVGSDPDGSNVRMQLTDSSYTGTFMITCKFNGTDTVKPTSVTHSFTITNN